MSGLIPRYWRYFSFFRTTSVGLAAAFPARERAYPDDMDGSPRGPYAHTGNICRMRNYRSPDAQLQIAGCATTDHRMRNYRSPDAQLQITGCAQFGPETLPQAPRRSYGKKKNIGNIWGSNRTYDVNFIFWWSVPLKRIPNEFWSVFLWSET